MTELNKVRSLKSLSDCKEHIAVHWAEQTRGALVCFVVAMRSLCPVSVAYLPVFQYTLLLSQRRITQLLTIAYWKE